MEMNMVAEGYHATEPVNKLNKSIGNSSPIIDNVYGILFLNKIHKKSLQKLSKKLT
jgi:glycerol-3-phosphate dehydrogenase